MTDSIREMFTSKFGKERVVDVLQGTRLEQYSKSKNIQKTEKGFRVRLTLLCKSCYGPYRVTFERAQQDLATFHAEDGIKKKKARLLELLKAAGNGVVRRGGRKPVPCAGVEAEKELADLVVPTDGVPKVAAVVVASCGAGSVGGVLSRPLPYGWYSKRVSKNH